MDFGKQKRKTYKILQVANNLFRNRNLLKQVDKYLFREINKFYSTLIKTPF